MERLITIDDGLVFLYYNEEVIVHSALNADTMKIKNVYFKYS